MNTRRRPNLIRRRWLSCALITCGLVAGLKAAAQDASRPVRPDYASFRIVTERNIFNANRSGGPVRPTRDTGRPSRVDALRLVGIMNYDKGSFAFFDGTSPDYRKALQPRATIAGFTVTNLTANSVILATEHKRIELRVGMQVRRADGGAWELADSRDLPAAPEPAPAPADSSGGDSGGDMSEVLKRLMQQREQE